MAKKKQKNILFFFLCFLPYLAITQYLFYNQSCGTFMSDLSTYCAVMVSIDRYHPMPEIPYPILFYTGRLFCFFTSPEHAIALAATILNGFTAVALKSMIDSDFEVQKQDSLKLGMISTGMAFSLLFVSMLYPLRYIGRSAELAKNTLQNLPGPPFRYLGVFSPNPYHNTTYLAARGFSVISFFLFADILSFYEKENKWYHRKYMLFSVFLALTTLAKPSFTLVMVATAGIIMTWRLLKNRFHAVKAFFQLGIYFIPTFLVLLYQYGGMFHTDQDTESAIRIGFLTAWSTASANVPRSILLAMAFPFAVLFFQLIQRKLPRILCFSWQFYLVALGTMLFLYEDNDRLFHLNFAWGYMYGLFFCHTASLIVLMKHTINRSQPLWQLGIQWGLYLLHLICGVEYFIVLMRGGLYF